LKKEKMTKREQILSLVKTYYKETYEQQKVFIPGDRISYGGRVFDEEEICNLVDSSLDFWLTTGHYAEQFEKDFAYFLQVKYVLLTNSGSSANLLAFMALTSPLLKDRAIQRGDEVISVACGFPTTIAPVIQFGAIPVFVDVTIPQYNIDTSYLEKALSPKTKAVIIAHTLGNPFDLKAIKTFCNQHNLWLIEDNCDALGSKYYINGEWKYTGTIGDIGTSSFYPPHHMTMGEGGAVYTDNPLLKRIVASIRDWGRDCFCPSGKDNTCNHRFDQQHGELPFGYDHKYVYSHFGYNLKVTDMQAAIGCAQLKKLPDFIAARKRNWNYLKEQLLELNEVFYLPEAIENSDPSWFGFLLTIKPNASFNRIDIINYLEKKNIQTRLLFAGNLLKHPCFNVMRESREGYRVVGMLKQTDIVMEQTFWIGVYPGMQKEMLQYMVEQIKSFVKTFK
jgi:CDP-6-deoxy-D-xylo-4-hexulose-3-dehydrase